MNIDTNNIKDILITGNYISEEDAQKAEDSAKKNEITFVEALLRDGVVNSDIVGQATAESFKVPYSDLNSAAISADQVRKIPEDVAKKLRVVLFNEDDEKLDFHSGETVWVHWIPGWEVILPDEH